MKWFMFMFIPDPGSRIRDADPGSLLFFIPDSNCLHPGSSTKYFNLKKSKKKSFLSFNYMTRLVHPGSRILDPEIDFLPCRML